MTYLANLNPIQLAALLAMVVGLIGFVVVNRGKVRDFFSNFRWGGGGGTTVVAPVPVVDQDTLEFQAWNLLRKKKSFQSPEAQQALKTLASHFVEV